MATIIEAPESNFTPHPAGTFIGIMRDACLRTRPNPWKGSENDKGQVDDRDTITELVLEFLTDHLVDIKGELLPGFVRYTATASVAENSNLRKFLKGWFPQLKDEDFKRFDADKLIGKGAYLTVSHRTDKKGNTWANVVGAMQPPKGSVLPLIPKDFVRYQDRPEQKAAQTQVQPPVTAGNEEDGSDLPF